MRLKYLALFFVVSSFSIHAYAGGGLDGGGGPGPADYRAWEIAFQFDYSHDPSIHEEWRIIQDFIRTETEKDALKVVEYYSDEVRDDGLGEARIYIEFLLSGNYGRYMIDVLNEELKAKGLDRKVHFAVGLARFSDKTIHHIALGEQDAKTFIEALPKIEPLDDGRVVSYRMSCRPTRSTGFLSCTVQSKKGIQVLTRENSLALMRILEQAGIATPYEAFVSRLICETPPARPVCTMDYFAKSSDRHVSPR